MTRRPHPGGFGPGHGFRWDSPGERAARQVRRASRSSRQRHGPRGPGGRGGPGGPPVAIPSPWVVLPLLIVVIGVLASAAAAAAAGAMFISPLFIMVLIGLSAHRGRRRMAPPPTVGMPRPQAAPAAPPWQQARARFDRLREEYAAYECDPMQVLRLPALADVAVPSTSRFVEAFAEAQALDTDAHPASEHAAAFVAAVDRAVRAWEAARDAAERIRYSTLTSTERASVERAIKLLTTARDSDNDAERLAAYAMARSELARLEKAGVVHLPRSAVAALENEGRGQLPA